MTFVPAWASHAAACHSAIVGTSLATLISRLRMTACAQGLKLDTDWGNILVVSLRSHLAGIHSRRIVKFVTCYTCAYNVTLA